jgi:hypothetical protein
MQLEVDVLWAMSGPNESQREAIEFNVSNRPHKASTPKHATIYGKYRHRVVLLTGTLLLNNGPSNLHAARVS